MIPSSRQDVQILTQQNNYHSTACLGVAMISFLFWNTMLVFHQEVLSFNVIYMSLCGIFAQQWFWPVEDLYHFLIVETWPPTLTEVTLDFLGSLGTFWTSCQWAFGSMLFLWILSFYQVLFLLYFFLICISGINQAWVWPVNLNSAFQKKSQLIHELLRRVITLPHWAKLVQTFFFPLRKIKPTF